MRRKSENGGRPSLYRRFWWAEDASWRLAEGLGLFVLGIGLFMAGFLLFFPLLLQPPARQELVALSGTVASVANIGSALVFRFAESPHAFRYEQKGGELEAVSQALAPGVKAEILVHIHDLESQSEPVAVFALSVDGREVRRFVDVQSAWNRDNDLISHVLGPIFLAISAVLAAVFFATALHERRREREHH